MRSRGNFLTLAIGLVCVVEAVLLLLDNRGTIHLHVTQIWGFALVAIGAAVIIGAVDRAWTGRRGRGPASTVEEPTARR